MAKCTYEFCRGDAEEDGYCVLHSRNPNKDKENFNKALAERPQKHNFRGILFPPGYVFEYTEFHDADFRQAKFMGIITFWHAKFSSWTNFQNAEFEEVIFRENTFAGEVDFRRVQFAGDAQFFDTNFEKGVNFEGITFNGMADFNHAKFGKDSYCSETIDCEEKNADSKSSWEANFREVTFSKKADFTCACFAIEADFGHAKFANDASFYNVKFVKTTETPNFIGTSFAEEVNFVTAKFENGANFVSAIFGKGANFAGTTFTGLILFDGARFRGRTLFEPETMRPEKTKRQDLVFSGADEVYFTNVALEPLEAVTFKGADFSKCRFEGTDLREAEITGGKWPRMARTFPLIPRRFAVYEEILLAKLGLTDSYSHIEQLYRQLKQNSEDRRDYERARDFHYGEKEMRRKNPETGWGLWGLLWLYRLVSGYGERALRPFLCALVLWVTCAWGYSSWGLAPKQECAGLDIMNAWDYLNYSLRVMTFLKPDHLIPLGCAAYVNTAESILGPILIGLFALALKQRLKR